MSWLWSARFIIVKIGLPLPSRAWSTRTLSSIAVGLLRSSAVVGNRPGISCIRPRSEEHTSELQSPCNLVCRLLLEKKKDDVSFNINAQRRVATTSRSGNLHSGRDAQHSLCVDHKQHVVPWHDNTLCSRRPPPRAPF